MNAESCTISEGEVAGWRALSLSNGLLRATVLPDKGADIYELRHLGRDVDVLWKRQALLPPGQQLPAHERHEFAFLNNYEGCWQELFPNCNDPATLGGVQLPFHGEAALLPWQDEVLAAGPHEVALRLTLRSALLPLRLERVMRLRQGEDALLLEESVRNEGDAPLPFVWGHHCVLGPPLLAAGCELRTPARTIQTIAEAWEPATARLATGQRQPWPQALGRDGQAVDLRRVPGPEAHSHDDVYLTDLEAGWAELHNPALALSFRLEWDADIFKWIISWQPFGGAEAWPLAGAYALGLEPWVAQGNLEQALAAGQARWLEPGATLSTTLRARIYEEGAES